MGRYSFDVELFHLLLHAGLSRRFPKTAQKHDYPSAAWRRSYARRTGAERGFATAKDPASNDIARGWCRLMGLAPLMLFTTTLLVVRNQRILHAWNTRQQENDRRAAAGLPPKTRKRRRKTLASLAAGTTLTRHGHDHPAPVTTSTAATTRRKHALTHDKPREPGPARPPKTPAPNHGPPGDRNVRGKRENRPH